MNKINIAIVDDHKIVRQGLISLFEEFEEINVIIEAENGSDFIEKLSNASTLPDAVLLDLEMPVMDGIDTTILLKKLYDSIKIIILTKHDSSQFIARLVEEGANAFLLKDEDIEIIVKAIHSVIEKGFYFNENFNLAVAKKWEKEKLNSNLNTYINLSEREMEVLKLVAEQKANSEIAVKLNIDVRTVNKHKENIIKKTNSKNIIGAVIYALKHDLLD